MQTPPAGSRLETLDTLTPSQIAAVTALVDDATDADGVRPLSEHVLLHLRHGGDAPSCNLLVWQGSPERLVGYAHLDVTDPVEGPSAEMAVDPASRRRGVGRAIIEAALERTGGTLRLWAHGDLPDASLMADRLGFTRVRSLWQMRRSMSLPLPAPTVPDGVAVRTFVPGVDDEAWLALNDRVFAHHPEQGRWTLADLRQRMAESWFDPEGFFLAERVGEPGKLLGFHWTKVHGADHAGEQRAQAEQRAHPGEAHHHGHAHEPIGEVYVLGVDPAAAGLGLGRALTIVGLRYLRAEGLLNVMLYVDGSNTGAIRLYESLGFTRWSTDVVFRRDPE